MDQIEDNRHSESPFKNEISEAKLDGKRSHN